MTSSTEQNSTSTVSKSRSNWLEYSLRYDRSFIYAGRVNLIVFQMVYLNGWFHAVRVIFFLKCASANLRSR